MNYVTAHTVQPETDAIFNSGFDPGTPIGFKSLVPHYNVKRGNTTYIGGIPSHGKTEWHLEVLMSLSEHWGWKHALFSPETGSPAEIVAELVHKYVKKPFGREKGLISDQELYSAYGWLNDQFYIMTPDEKKVTVDELLEIAREIKQSKGLDSISIDPWNELMHDYSKHGGREDKYLEYVLGKLRRFAREEKVHVFVIAHPRTLRAEKGKHLPPTAFEISGGAAWFAKAESILCVHRPDFTSNTVDIIIQKAKPKSIGKQGTVTLYWDHRKSRYYATQDLSSEHLYSQKLDVKQIKAEAESLELPF